MFFPFPDFEDLSTNKLFQTCLLKLKLSSKKLSTLMNSEDNLQEVIRKAKLIRQRCQIKCTEIQTNLSYQQSIIESHNSFSLFRCTICFRPGISVNKSFQRAYKALSLPEQAQYYLMCVSNIEKLLEERKLEQKLGPRKEANMEKKQGTQPIKIKLMVKDKILYKKFTEVNSEISRIEKTIKIVDINEQIDLHKYILRISRGKIKHCLVLQSMDQSASIETIRIIFSSIDFQDSYDIIYKVWAEAQYQSLKKKYESNIESFKKKGIRTELQIENIEPITHKTNNIYTNFGQSVKGTEPGSPEFGKPNRQNPHSTNQLINGLNSFQHFHEESFGVFYEKKGKKVRRRFELSEESIKIQQIFQGIDDIHQMKERKNCISQIKHLTSIPSERTNLYREIDSIDKKLFEFIYFRHYFVKNSIHYFVEKSVDLQQFQNSRNKMMKSVIGYCIWRVRKVGKMFEVLVEADISYPSKVKVEEWQKVSAEYIGDFQSYIQKKKKSSIIDEHLKNEEISICSEDFENQYLEEITLENQQQEFFTVTGTLNSQNEQVLDHEFYQQNQYKIQESPHAVEGDENTGQQTQSSAYTQQKYLRHHYQIDILPKGTPTYMRQSKGHLLFGSQWVINQHGDLVNINKEKIKLQGSVLGLVIQRMGKNLFSGKGIMNLSLPVEIFGTDSNLQRIARGYIYAPNFLQRAAQQISPIQRMKNIFCFALGFSTSYIKMEKPFNPVLGQTYQARVDGCPVYAEQISHHPPICSTFMVGRGYKAYGNYEAKVQLGLNTASGINQGFTHIQFVRDDSVVKFNIPPGQMHGIVVGDRRLLLSKKSYFIDESNLLFCQVSWGKNSKSKKKDSNMNDFFCGKIVRLKQQVNFDIENLKKIKDKDVEQSYGEIHGRFTGEVYFENELLFDLGEDPPHLIQDYYPCLPSDSRLRKDIIEKKKKNDEGAQEAKQQIQEIQRRDEKLRKEKNK